jgi:hypothetical protein
MADVEKILQNAAIFFLLLCLFNLAVSVAEIM